MLHLLSAFIFFQCLWLICWWPLSFQLSFCFIAQDLYVDAPSPFSFHFISILMAYSLMLLLLSAFILFQCSWLIRWCFLSFQLSFCFNAHGMLMFPLLSAFILFQFPWLICWLGEYFQFSLCFNAYSLSVDVLSPFSFLFVSMLMAYMLMLPLLSAFMWIHSHTSTNIRNGVQMFKVLWEWL